MRENSVTLNSIKPVGRRFMALLGALNTGNRDKLRDFIRESLATTTLENGAEEEIIASYENIYRETGGIQVHHVYSSHDHLLIVVVRGQNNDLLYMDKIRVEEDTPHRILEFQHARLDD